MKVAIVHTDFRLYWPARLNALSISLLKCNVKLSIIEIAGLGSPYFFAGNKKSLLDWQCIFPEERIEDISPEFAKSSVCTLLDIIQPDIVISGPIAYSSGAASVYWAVKNRKKVIVFDDARLEDVPRPWWVNSIKKKIYSCVDAIFCPAPEWRSTFNKFGIPAEKLFYGVNVVDNDFWSKENEKTYPLGDKKFFLAVGRQIPKKNFHVLLKSYHNYTTQTPNHKYLVLIGDGPEHGALSDYVKNNGLESKVYFFPFLSPEELRSFYQSASWIILPSSFGESWGLVVNEAMAAGLPVLVSNQAGCATTLVSEGINGYLFSPDIKSITRILSLTEAIDEEKRGWMGKRSQEIISEWGLQKFCKGLQESIDYVSKKKHTHTNFFIKTLLKIWKGRYRPV